MTFKVVLLISILALAYIVWIALEIMHPMEEHDEAVDWRKDNNNSKNRKET